MIYKTTNYGVKATIVGYYSDEDCTKAITTDVLTFNNTTPQTGNLKITKTWSDNDADCLKNSPVKFYITLKDKDENPISGSFKYDCDGVTFVNTDTLITDTDHGTFNFVDGELSGETLSFIKGTITIKGLPIGTKYKNIQNYEDNQLIHYKDSFFKKIFNKIMNYIKRE